MDFDTQELLVQKGKVQVDLVEAFKPATQTKGQVVLHCTYCSPPAASWMLLSINISRNCYLFDCNSDYRSKLVHVEGVPLSPQNMSVRLGIPDHFTLIFEGLPKSCTRFGFCENSDIGDEFKTPSTIFRNEIDVYHVTLNC